MEYKTIIALILFRWFTLTCLRAGAPIINYELNPTSTCDPFYGAVIESLRPITSALVCVMHCVQTETCMSAIYMTAKYICELNNSTAEIVALPPSCGDLYLELPRPLPAEAVNLGSCGTWSPCTVNGSECVTGICECRTGWVFDRISGVCASNYDMSACNTTDFCFEAYIANAPWQEGTENSRTELACDLFFPNASLPIGKMKVRLITAVPATIDPYALVVESALSTTEMLLSNAWELAGSPFTFGFQMVYRTSDVPNSSVPPQTQCQLSFV